MLAKEQGAASRPACGDSPSDGNDDEAAVTAPVARAAAFVALVGLAWWVVDGSASGILMYVGAAGWGAIMGATTLLTLTFYVVGPDDDEGNETIPVIRLTIGSIVGALCIPWVLDVSSTHHGLVYGFGGGAVLAVLLTACVQRSGGRARPRETSF